MAMPGRSGGFAAESGIPTGLNRIKTRRERGDSWGEDSDHFDESSPGSGLPVSEFHVRRALSRGHGRLGRSKEGFHKGRKIAQWFESSFSKDSHRVLYDSPTGKATSSELGMPETEDYKSKICRMAIIYPSDSQIPADDLPKRLKSFSHGLDLKDGNQSSGTVRARSLNNLKELVQSLRSRFDAAKEVVDTELGSVSCELLQALQKDGDLTDDEYTIIKELYVLTQQCIDMSPLDFRTKCEIIVRDLTAKRQACQVEMMRLLFTRVLFILTRCTRLLHFVKDSEPTNESSLDKFRKCLERIPSIDMNLVSKGFAESEMECAPKQSDDAMKKMQGEGQLAFPNLEIGKCSEPLPEKPSVDFLNVLCDADLQTNQSTSADLSSGVMTLKINDMIDMEALNIQKGQCLDDSNSVICRICEEPVPTEHLEPHSYICAFAEKCFSKHLDVNDRLMIAAELLDHLAESCHSNNQETFGNTDILRAGILNSALHTEVYSPKCGDWRCKGMDGMLENLHEMDTACIEDSHLANLATVINHWLARPNVYSSPSSNGSMTSTSSTCSPSAGTSENFCADLFLLEQEDVKLVCQL
ncbi:hypothetical protein M569_15694, partial [Genlisea aurea]